MRNSETHKHQYKYIGKQDFRDANGIFTLSRYRCKICGKTIFLDSRISLRNAVYTAKWKEHRG